MLCGNISLMREEKTLNQKILVVDDDPFIREFLLEALSSSGSWAECAGDGISALRLISEKDFDILLTDLRLPGMDGIELLRQVKQIKPGVEVIIMTGYGTVESAVEAIKTGAFHYIEKPVNLELLNSLLEKIRQLKSLYAENRLLKESISKYRKNYGEIIGSSPRMQEVFTALEKVKGKDLPVFIYGESGTGKELVARTIWKESLRADEIFIPVNCGTIVPTIAESELFGHVKGAFTGALKDKKGLFEAANGGTLFLDEVTELPIGIQVKLLRAIEQQKIRRVGDSKERSVNVRLIAATNENPDSSLQNGKLRKDLYFRLNVVSISLPPLREREGDLELLLDHFLKKHGEKRGIGAITEEAMDHLKRYHWPGNIRELEHFVLRALLFRTGEMVGIEDLAIINRGMLSHKGIDLSPPYSLKEKELDLIKAALQKTGGKKKEAATLLGIHPTTLYRKLKALGIEPRSI